MTRLWKAGIALLMACCTVGLSACGVTPRRVRPTVAATVETSQPTQPQTEPEPETQPQTEPETQPETQPLITTYDSVPLYYQTDYPFVKYGNGTIGTSGCSITCMAMIATYMTDHPYMPDELAYHFGEYGKNNVERLEYVAEQLGLPYEKNFNWRETQQALREGKVAVVMENGRSPFTTEQHFLVLSGLTDDDRVIVKDPFEPNYSVEELEQGFIKGFSEYAITSGYSGGWVFDKSAMPENPTLFDASKPKQRETRYVGYDLPEEDVYELACYAWQQARNEPEEVQQAVVEVILNRLVSKDFPNTVDWVLRRSELYSKAVFTGMAYAEPDMPQYRAVDAAMYGPYILPMDVYYFSHGPSYGTVWGEVGSFTFRYD